MGVAVFAGDGSACGLCLEPFGCCWGHVDALFVVVEAAVQAVSCRTYGAVVAKLVVLIVVALMLVTPMVIALMVVAVPQLLHCGE